jgi:hypothetical protein
MNHFSKTLSLLASGLLGTVLILAPAGFALAQDAADEDASQHERSCNSFSIKCGPEVAVPNLSGCWQGNAFNDSQGNTSILFVFGQTKNKINKKLSSIDLQPASHVHGNISGTVKPTQFSFHGKVASGCNIKGTGFIQKDGTLSGNYHYAGKCFENGFTGGDFSKVTLLGPTCP